MIYVNQEGYTNCNYLDIILCFYVIVITLKCLSEPKLAKTTLHFSVILYLCSVAHGFI